MTGGVDESYSTLRVDVASDFGTLHDPSTPTPALHNPPTFGNLVIPFIGHDQQSSPTRSPVLPTPIPEEFRHQTVSTSQRSSYSELAANLMYLSEANENGTSSVTSESLGSEPPFHAPCNSSYIDPVLAVYSDAKNPNYITPPLTYKDTIPRSHRSNPGKNPDSKAKRYSSQTSGRKRAGRSRERRSKTEVRVCAR